MEQYKSRIINKKLTCYTFQLYLKLGKFQNPKPFVAKCWQVLLSIENNCLQWLSMLLEIMNNFHHPQETSIQHVVPKPQLQRRVKTPLSIGGSVIGEAHALMSPICFPTIRHATCARA
jgi:hypothetical protein